MNSNKNKKKKNQSRNNPRKISCYCTRKGFIKKPRK